MRIVPFLTALLVAALLFVVILEREALMAFAGRGDDAVVATDVDETDSEPTTPLVNTDGADLQRVVVITSHAQEIDSAVVLRGETESAREVVVRAETTGQVISEPHRKGAFVEAGEIICQLDPGTRHVVLAQAQAGSASARAQVPQVQAQMKEAQARLSEAEINDKVATQLSKTGYASDTRVASTQASVLSAQAAIQSARSGLETAQAGIRAAEASVASAEKDIERLTIRAPFSGLLETDGAELGSLLTTGGTCATIIQLDPIKFVGYVPETEVDRVELGSLAGARLTGGREVVGKVIFLSRSADPQTRTFRVDIEVANADQSIRDGQTAEILISSAGKKAHLLPQSTLTLDDSGDLGVRIVEDGTTVLFKPLELIRDTAEGVWVTGLDDTADVIVVGQEFVTDGVQVTPTYREAKQ